MPVYVRDVGPNYKQRTLHQLKINPPASTGACARAARARAGWVLVLVLVLPISGCVCSQRRSCAWRALGRLGLTGQRNVRFPCAVAPGVALTLRFAGDESMLQQYKRNADEGTVVAVSARARDTVTTARRLRRRRA
jgi:hypothetical protein